MSFETEKLRFLADLHITPEIIADEQAFDSFADYPDLQDDIESLILSKMRVLGYKWKQDAVFDYDDPSLVEAMHYLLRRQYEDCVEDYTDQMQEFLCELSAEHDEVPPEQFFTEILHSHYDDFNAAAEWVTDHSYAAGKDEDEELNQDAYDLFSDLIEPAGIIAERLRLHRKTTRPTAMVMHLKEAYETGGIKRRDHSAISPDDIIADIPQADATLSPDETPGEEEYPDHAIKGLTKARTKVLLPALGLLASIKRT